MTTTFKSIINYEALGLEENFNGICFGNAFSKTYEYGTIAEKV
jgi:hypothetical protein